MGLGKTIQVILALRLLFNAGLIRRALVVCPKPLVINWSRELRTWAEDLPFEVIGGDTETRRAALARVQLPAQAGQLRAADARRRPNSPTSACISTWWCWTRPSASRAATRRRPRRRAAIRRDRSWAMTGTPIENRIDDLVNIFEFVDPGRIPPETPAKMLPELTRDCILRRTKEEAAPDMPPRVYRDAFPELTPEQREAYDLAEKEGVVHLNELGDTITVQHVFELVMRLKQICNFDPRTGKSAKLEQLQADLAEVAESGRKAIIFSQWVEPLETLAEALREFGPLQYHGKVPHKDREAILDRFKRDPTKHVILMSYGTGSVGLNLQFTNYVFLFDRWWNPAVEDQAINRAHRLGQKEPVFITRFVTPSTIEGRIAEVLEKKRELFNELIGQNGPPPSLGLSEADVFSLFHLRARPRRAAA